MAVDSMHIASLTRDRRRTDYFIDDKSRRDYTILLNSLLLLTDFACLLASAYIAAKIHGAWFASSGFDDARWGVSYIAGTIAVLAAVVLYDKRFISVASRGHTGALVRCYFTGFALFICGVVVIGLASGTLHTVPVGLIALWLTLSFLFTATLRVLQAKAVQLCVRNGMLMETVAIVGAGERAERLAESLRHTKPITPKLLGVFDDSIPPSLGVVESDGHIATPPGTVTGNIDMLIELGKIRRIDWIFLTLPDNDEGKVLSVVNRLKALSVPIGMCPPNLAGDPEYRPVDFIGNGVPVTLLRQSLPDWRAKLKVIGQFLPRWITTLMLLSTLLVRKAWSGLRAIAATRRIAKPGTQGGTTDKLVCELDDYDLDKFMGVVQDFGQSRLGYVVTPNADHIIRLHEEPAFHKAYASATYVLLDSRFLANLLHATTGIRFPVCTGSDLTGRLFDTIAPADRLLIVGGSSAQIETLRERHGWCNVAHYNPPMGFIRDEAAVEACLQFIEANSPFRYCVLAFGTPQQEVFVERLHARGIARGLVFCVGASINFLTGGEQRAPLWMRHLGLEWLFRLARNPRRLAHRYLVRGPRVFSLLRKTKFVLRRAHSAIDAREKVAARAA